MYTTFRVSATIVLLVLSASVLAVGPKDGLEPVDGRASTSETTRLVTGTPDHLQAVVDGGVAAGAAFAGMAGSYKGHSGAAGTRLYFEYQLGGWQGVLYTWQIAVDLSGLSNGVGSDLIKPVENCQNYCVGGTDDGAECDGHDPTCAFPGECLGGNAECEAVYSAGAVCIGTEPGLCEVAYQDDKNPLFAISWGIATCNQQYLACDSFVYHNGQLDTGETFYGGALVLELAAGARGDYQLCPLTNAATFMVISGVGDIAVKEFYCANVQIPVGQCCNLTDQTCLDDVTIAECDEQIGRTRFVEDATCSGVDCIPTDGACCDRRPGLGGACTLEEEVDCPQDGLHTFTLNTECGDVACEEINGACCDGITGVCTVVQAGACDGTHLVWSLELCLMLEA